MTSGPDEPHQVDELLDLYRDRASMSDGAKMMIAPGKVLDNVKQAMERVDNDINTPVAVEDFVSPEELWVLIDAMQMGPLVVAHAVNTGFRIMLGRYPGELVLAPFAPGFDVRAIVPLEVDDHQHALARAIVERRAADAGELSDDEVAEQLAGCSSEDQTSVFVAVFYMYGLKVDALKHRLGID